MTHLKIGSSFPIYSYKHSKEIHRVWRLETLLDKTDDMVILGKMKTKVIEASGRNWMTHEPSIGFFFKDKFFNIMAMIRKEGIFYYCNIASPAVIDEEGLKYIDYDLDVSVNPNFEYRILDRQEFEYHRKKFNYSDGLVKVLYHHLDKLKEMIEKRAYPFDHDVVYKLYDVLKKEKKLA